MRFEEKELDGPVNEREHQRERERELVREDDKKLPALRPEELFTDERQARLIGAMRMILERQHLVVNDLALPKRELVALETLKAAVEGRDAKLHQFVYAHDRRDMLEQALAILQPDLVHKHDTVFRDLVDRVSNLRCDLRNLEDAQDNLLEANPEVGLVVTDGDRDEQPEPKPPEGDTSLSGPERKVEKPPSSLAGPEREVEKPPSSLTGPALPEAPASKTTLGSDEDLAAASEHLPEPQKKKPWWRRPFG